MDGRNRAARHHELSVPPPDADRPPVTPVAGMSQGFPQTQFGLLRSMDWTRDDGNHTRFGTHFVEVQSVGLNAMRWSGDFAAPGPSAELEPRTTDVPGGGVDRRVESHGGGLLSPRLQPTTVDRDRVIKGSGRTFHRPPFESRAIDRPSARAVAREVPAARTPRLL